MTEEAVSTVTELLKNSSSLSIAQGAQATGMSKTSFYRAVIKAGYHAYRPTTVQALSDDDFQKRLDFCSTMLAKFDQDTRLVDKILWSDESQFMLNGTVNRHNCCSWAPSNPHEQIPVSNSKLGVMVWCGMTSAGLVGPYFFEDSVTGESYLDMLSEFVCPQLMRQRLFFQPDGSPVHYANSVKAWLSEKFPDRWIGRGGPVEWPARSPDLTPPDFFLWGYLKHKVYAHRPRTIVELMDRIRQACAEIPIEMCKRACQNVPIRLKRCQELGGRQISN